MLFRKSSGRRVAHRPAAVNTSMRRNGPLALAVTAALAAVLIPQAAADEGTPRVATSASTGVGSTTVGSGPGAEHTDLVERYLNSGGDDGGKNDGGKGDAGERGGKRGPGKDSSNHSSKDSDGRQELAAPLDKLERTSPFGPRVSPITGAPSEFHTGQDYAGVCGTPVKNSADGKVTETGWHPYGGGMRITVSHGDGLQTTYNHLSSIGVNVGDRVDTGDRIGSVGSTGASTGCHLHFEVVVDGDTVNPLNWL